MSCPRDLAETKELIGKDDSKLWMNDDGGVWIDGGDVNRLLLHHGLPGLESMGGKPNLDAIGDRCPKDDVDLIVMEGGDRHDPLSYGICEVCGGMWLELGLETDDDIETIEESILDFFRDFRRANGNTRSARP